jgi:D-glucosaminate-6-phosphate ammonia-lyase
MQDILPIVGALRVINAAGTLTRLGGSNVDPEVASAMATTAQLSIDGWDLQAAACARIAALTGAEAGIVTAGASAALTLAAAAVIAGTDAAAIDLLPDTGDKPNEIVIPRTHRNGYDKALRIAGARIVECGVNDRGTGAGVRGLEAWEIEARIGPKTVALAAAANPASEPDLSVIIDVGRRRGLPVIIDAAAQLPPRVNLSRFVGMGASLVAFSGGKAIRGPQGSGLLIGLRELIASACLQMLDMDVRPESFRAPRAFFPEGAPNSLPRHGIGRGFKAAKESVVGLLLALERFAASDASERARMVEARLTTIAQHLADIAELRVTIEPPVAPERLPRAAIELIPSLVPVDAAELAVRLRTHSPAIVLVEGQVDANRLLVDLACVTEEDDRVIVAAIRDALRAPAKPVTVRGRTESASRARAGTAAS